MADEIAILIPDEAITTRLLAADAPQMLPIPLRGAWLTMAEAKPPVLEDANRFLRNTKLLFFRAAPDRADTSILTFWRTICGRPSTTDTQYSVLSIGYSRNCNRYSLATQKKLTSQRC